METQKFKFLFKKVEIEFWLVLKSPYSINIQVGLNMHLYVDIVDAPSPLWGSTSSYIGECWDEELWYARMLISKALIYKNVETQGFDVGEIVELNSNLVLP